MKSKEVHKVILRTPRMRRVRNNLRILLKLAVKSELNRLSAHKHLYYNKKLMIGLTLSQKRRYYQLQKESNKLSEYYNKSTLQCGGGAACYSLDKAIEEGLDPRDRPTDLDLVWVPWLERWFCLKCFVLDQLGELTHKDFDDPMYRKWVKKEFGI